MANEQGRLQPVELEGCPWSDEQQACRLVKHSWRNRRFPAGLRLRILRCKSHEGRYFTVYPAGLAPYARDSLAPVELSGHLLHKEESLAKPGADPRWRETVFPGCR